MKIKHVLNNQIIERDTDNLSFLMTNKAGGYVWLDNWKSRYQGVFFKENGKMFKVLEFLGGENEELLNNFWNVEKKGESYFMPDFCNAFVWKGNDTDVWLDFRESYEQDNGDYFYEEFDRGKIIRIEYKGEKFYLVLRFDGEFEEKNKWQEKEYEYDKNRSSSPFKKWVYLAGNVRAEKIVFCFSQDRDKAIQEGDRIFNETEKLENDKKQRLENTNNIISDEKVNLAYNSCRILLDNIADDTGMYAGLPWFFQYWARDELISLKGYYSVNKEKSKDILGRWLKELKNSEGFKIASKLKVDGSFEGDSVDALGWMFKRLELFPELLQENKEMLDEFFSKLDDSFIETKGNTWMDAITRENAVEIQVMKLYALNLASKLTNKQNYREIENKLKEKIRNEFWNGEYLKDSNEDRIRSNVFIVYYFYPELLTRGEWEKCFDRHLEELWCEWGGISSLSKNDKEFHKDYSGEIPGSYHNGDSWFWVNNLAGWCLADFDREKYYEFIKQILNASSEEILFSGCAGNHAELSSASKMKSEGAVCQAFSAGFFVELVEKLKSF